MNTVTLIRLASGFDNVPDGFVFAGEGYVLDEQAGERDETYALPEGYEVLCDGTCHGIFYDGFEVELDTHSSGWPQLIPHTGDTCPVLSLAA